MASSNQLTARVDHRHSESIENLAEDRDIRTTDAERVVVRAGLEKIGYLEESADRAMIFQDYARKIGTVLGFVGLTVIGYGIFGIRAFQYMGFGLVLAGFGLIAGAEFAPSVSDKIDSRGGQSPEEAA